MQVNIDNLDHVIASLNGFEDLRSGELSTPDAIYAKTVLKLNGVDFKGRVGSESFLSSIKEGAVKFYEMIKNFLKGIRDFFFGSKGSSKTKTVDENLKSTERASIEIKQNADVFKKVINPDMVTAIEKAKAMADNIAKLQSGERVSLMFGSYLDVLYGSVNSILDAKMAASHIENMPGPKFNQNSFKYKEVRDTYQEIIELCKKNTITETKVMDNAVIYVFDQVPVLVKLQQLYKKFRTEASTGLDSVTKDLEFNNEVALKFAKHNDEILTSRSNEIQKVCKLMSTASTKYTYIIEHCDKQIERIKAAVERLNAFAKDHK